MPKQTFFNLAPERQKAFLEAAYEEFALHEYRSASVSRILRKLDISKGSFYQYFEDKKELYFYLIEQSSSMRFTEVEALFEDDEIDFFELLVENYVNKIRFDLNNPVISGFLYNVGQEKNSEEVGNVQLQMKQMVLTRIVELVEKHKRKGTLAPESSTYDAAHLILQVQWGIYEYLEMKYHVSFRDNVLRGQPVFTLPEEEILRDVRSFANMLKNGIGSRIRKIES